MSRLGLFIIIFISLAASAEPRQRPHSWGTQVIGVSLENMYIVDRGVYRSEQPDRSSIKDFKVLGINEILNLREYHSDNDNLQGSGLTLHRIKMDTGKVTEDQIISALKIIKNRKGPILIHCWHGSDRTGVTVAAYRVVFNNWTKERALDEMLHGGYGYHSTIYANLARLVKNLNVARIRNALGIKVKVGKVIHSRTD